MLTIPYTHKRARRHADKQCGELCKAVFLSIVTDCHSLPPVLQSVLQAGAQPLIMHAGRLYKQHVRCVHQTSLAFSVCRSSATLTFWGIRHIKKFQHCANASEPRPSSASAGDAHPSHLKLVTFPVRTCQLAVYILINIKLCQRTTDRRFAAMHSPA